MMCTAKAEFTQYPHNSRQDCWAIVSAKAARVTTRQAVDIIAVIDNSGSMAGMKLNLVKETLLRLIHQRKLMIASSCIPMTWKTLHIRMMSAGF